jgi:hypothetical protein
MDDHCHCPWQQQWQRLQQLPQVLQWLHPSSKMTFGSVMSLRDAELAVAGIGDY